LEWRDVLVGAVATAFLFTVGKSLIGLYIGSSAVASSYGAAGAVIVILLWIYYSSQIFLLGAEFTKVYASHHGSYQAAPQTQVATERQSPDQSRLPASRSALTDRAPPPASPLYYLLVIGFFIGGIMPIFRRRR
jgi:uncharacterized BrkB/YihY/UPF0761 family membrane protein